MLLTLNVDNCCFMLIDVQGPLFNTILDNKSTAVKQLRQSGATLLSTEMVIYELLGEAGTKNFKSMLPYLKDPSTA